MSWEVLKFGSSKVQGDTMKSEKTMVDGQGNVVPLRYVKKYDRERDRIARRILARWIKTRSQLRACYEETLADIEALEIQAAGSERKLGGEKGNLTFQSFDGLVQIARLARYELRFDERLQAARDLIYAMLEDKTAGIDADIAVIIRGVFAPSSEGMLSRSRVLGLLRYDIRNPSWVRAMDLIRESISSKRGKTLLAVSQKANREAEWESILLDVAKVADGGENGEVSGQQSAVSGGNTGKEVIGQQSVVSGGKPGVTK